MNENQPIPAENEESKPKKRGRKPGQKRKGYFYEEEEQAFKDYMLSDDQAYRDKLFREKLYPAFTKMIESIIRRYDLFTPTEDFTDTFNDTMSFLITKMNNYDVTKGRKVYSYCGTICKNYLILKRTKHAKKRERFLWYDDLFPESNHERDDGSEGAMNALNDEVINAMKSEITDMIERNAETEEMSDSCVKVGYALIEILENWDEIFRKMGSDKFNKTSVLYFIREYSMLKPKEVREGLKLFKEVYFKVKKNVVEE